MNSSYEAFQNKKRSVITVTLSPSAEVMKKVYDEYERITGTDNTYEHREVYEALYKEARTEFTLNNRSFAEAEVFAESIRIDNPDQNVNISDGEGNFVCHVTWNDQMKMFFEYPTYTQRGLALAMKRQAEAAEQGVVASWE